jgi:hypothetical protein
LINCIEKVDLVTDTIDAANDNIDTEQNKMFEGISCHTVVCPKTVVVHHFNTPITFAAMVH